MAGFNKVMLLGNITRDIELRYTPSGSAVCDIGLAVNQKKKGGDEVLFINCTAWEKTAELAAEYLEKGRQVLIEGRLKLDTWNDKDTGQKREKISVVVNNMVFVGSKNENTASPSQTETVTSQPQQLKPEQQQIMDSPIQQDQDSIPF